MYVSLGDEQCIFIPINNYLSSGSCTLVESSLKFTSLVNVWKNRKEEKKWSGKKKLMADMAF